VKVVLDPEAGIDDMGRSHVLTLQEQSIAIGCHAEEPLKQRKVALCRGKVPEKYRIVF
jgi:hypothetical protein